MTSQENWCCPYCERFVTLGPRDISDADHTLTIENTEGQVTLSTRFRVCPNPDCSKYSLQAVILPTRYSAIGVEATGKKMHDWQLVPFGSAKQFPDYIPRAIRDDYSEACLILDLSPKASATLCRRCLQGMVRDFWQVDAKSNRLWDELKQIKDKIDPGVWSAIVALKDLGNIGAHMESDVNVIIDVDPGEAGLLIDLIESLFKDWYVQRHERNERNAALVAAAATKKADAARK